MVGHTGSTQAAGSVNTGGVTHTLGRVGGFTANALLDATPAIAAELAFRWDGAFTATLPKRIVGPAGLPPPARNNDNNTGPSHVVNTQACHHD